MKFEKKKALKQLSGFFIRHSQVYVLEHNCYQHLKQHLRHPLRPHTQKYLHLRQITYPFLQEHPMIRKRTLQYQRKQQYLHLQLRIIQILRKRKLQCQQKHQLQTRNTVLHHFNQKLHVQGVSMSS